MRLCALLLVTALSLAFAPVPFPRPRTTVSDPNQAELAKMQGTWITVRRTRGGTPLRARGEMTVVIAGNRIKYLVDGEVRTEWVITLDSSKKPGIFDRKKVGGAAKTGHGTILRGLYRLEGDTLTTCYLQGGTERPADLDGSQPGVWLHVLQRKKP